MEKIITEQLQKELFVAERNQKEVLNKLTNKDLWANNHKENIKLFIETEVKKALKNAYACGFECARKAYKK
jgi:hypothetical protein|tara:strand:+ start:1863 stop:2075 length:213 start_codon:yes stop_codon:yes gene_type:complete